MANHKNTLSNKKTKTVKDTTNIIIIIGMIAITLFTIGFIIISITNPGEYKTFSDLQATNNQEFLNLEGNENNEYYVYIFQNDTYKNDLTKDTLLVYANYVRDNRTGRPLYVLDYGIDYGDVIKSTLNYSESDLESKLPTLILVTNGQVSNTKFDTVSAIKNELESQMNPQT